MKYNRTSKRKRAGLSAVTALAAAAMMCVTPMVSLAGTEISMQDGRYVSTEGNVIAGALYRGVSVSKYQGAIDWAKAARDDVDFAMIRMGYVDSLDPTFDTNMRNAAAAGIRTGTYLYSQALTVERAVEEAQFAVRTAKEYAVSYPIAMDVESQYISGLSRQELTDIVNAFCGVVADAGYYPVVYSYHDWFVNKMDTEQIPYDIWYARYGGGHEYKNRTIWQYAADGSVDGIQGPVCMELAFTDYSGKIPPDSWKRIDGRLFYFNAYQKVNGWIQNGEARSYLDPEQGLLISTDRMIDGVMYHFDENGHAV